MENSISWDPHVVSARTQTKKKFNFLGFTASLWAVVAIIGQWIFTAYLVVFYAGNALSGNIQAWNERGPQGIIEGDPIGNVAMAIHVLIAAIIMFIGPLQLVPQVRKYAPKFHRMSGRIYLVTAVLVSMAGVYMIWTRGTVGGLDLHIANTIDAGLIVLFGIMAWRTAVARNFKVHRKWTLRLFMVVSAVWFYRIGLMFWLGIMGGPVGIDFETFTGPFLSFLAFAQYMLPLAILELYFWAESKQQPAIKVGTGVVLLAAAGATAMGIFIATMGMWLPHM